MMFKPLGPLMIDVPGTVLTAEDRGRLQHPLVGGVILFTRNFVNIAQLQALTDEIHALRTPALVIAVDHEGGRVQRFREGFTLLPAMGALGQLWDQNSDQALGLARQVGYVLAAELRACGVDFSFTPVLDLDYGHSAVIGARAFHRQPEIVVALAAALITGLEQGGMRACGKHFPGHGWASADSHVGVAVDNRTLEALQDDILPYRKLPLDAVMPGHVVYPAVDDRSCGFSRRWNRYLREELGFSGVIFSDDLSMEGAGTAGTIVDRVQAAYAAGSEVLLVCNAPDKVDLVLESWQPDPALLPPNDRSLNGSRIRSLVIERPAPGLPGWAALRALPEYLAAVEAIARFMR